MQFYDESYNLHIELDTKGFELSPAEIKKIEQGIDPLREHVAKVPVPGLHLTVEHHRHSGRYQVKAALQLPGRGLTTGGIDEHLMPAVQQCVFRQIGRASCRERGQISVVA